MALALGCAVAGWLLPTQDTAARLMVLLGLGAGAGLATAWLLASRPGRWALVTAAALLTLWALWPRTPPGDLRERYCANLRRYAGLPYRWGAEGELATDCSGLVRRAWYRTLAGSGQPRLLAAAAGLWWRDCTAADLLAGAGGTEPVGSLDRLCQPPPAWLQAGDLAITAGGVHVLAYLGGGTWINADPQAQVVITLDAASTGSSWIGARVAVVRWRSLTTGPSTDHPRP
ncbi:MAG: C40 family peptidase [Planctomycetes bacterium]|nr:C40 family peptidase [Planctomycetota bacterium]